MTVTTDHPAPSAGSSATTASEPRHRRTLALVVVTAAAWALTLDNAVFIDESVYIRAGQAYIDHWLHGVPLSPDVGTGFSGLPVLYPVLAGMLDLVGGLAIVRAFSLVCLVATALVLRSLTAHLFGERAGMLAAAMFAFTGPSLYVGHLGTFDAVVILILALALWLGLTQKGHRSAVAMGLLLALAVATKYTAYVFVLPILTLAVFDRSALLRSMRLTDWVRRPGVTWSRMRRSLLAGAVTVIPLVCLFLVANDTAKQALSFTTTSRSALSPMPRDYLLGQMPDFAWPVLLCGALGVILSAYDRRWGASLFSLGLFATALLLPTGQLILGEGVSFHKHLAYSALFLAPAAGLALKRIWSYSYSLVAVPIVLFLISTFMVAAFRSHDLIEYPDVRPVVAATQFTEGEYLSSSADSLAYYTRRDPYVKWVPTFNLYAEGEDAIRRAVEEQRYELVILHAGPTGSTIQDEGQRALLSALGNSDYTRKVVGEDEQWLVYKK